MYVKHYFSLPSALVWTRRVFIWMAAWSTVITAAYVYLDIGWLVAPALPISILGTAVSFYLGFKGNAAYNRLWEARKIWGGIVNTSRTWGAHVCGMATNLHRDKKPDVPLAELHRELIYRHIGWLGALRTQLRRPTSWEHHEPSNDRSRQRDGTFDNSDDRLRERVAPFVEAQELEELMRKKNRATQLVMKQSSRLTELYADDVIDNFRHIELARLVEELYALQGKCERIKNFPLPRQYASANHWFVNTFIALLPLALLDVFRASGHPAGYVWLTIPASIAVGWVFYCWDLIVDYTENPFEGLVNDIPMDALSRTIEIDLREMLGETDLPAPLEPNADGVLF